VQPSAGHVFLYLRQSLFFLGALDSSSSEEDCRFLFDVVATLLAIFVDVLSRVVEVGIFRVEVRRCGVETDEELDFFVVSATAAAAAAAGFLDK